MDINEIRRLSLQYAKGHVKTGEFWRQSGRKRPKDQTYVEWFAASIKNPKKAGPPPKPTAKIRQEGDLCGFCNIPVIRQSHRNPPKEKPGGYWFEWWFKCPQCCRLYMVEESKRLFGGSAPETQQAGKTAHCQTDAYLRQDPDCDGIPPW